MESFGGKAREEVLADRVFDNVLRFPAAREQKRRKPFPRSSYGIRTAAASVPSPRLAPCSEIAMSKACVV